MKTPKPINPVEYVSKLSEHLKRITELAAAIQMEVEWHNKMVIEKEFLKSLLKRGNKKALTTFLAINGIDFNKEIALILLDRKEPLNRSVIRCIKREKLHDQETTGLYISNEVKQFLGIKFKRTDVGHMR